MLRKKLISIDVIQDNDKTNVSGLPENLTLRMGSLELPIKIGIGAEAAIINGNDPKEGSEKDQQNYLMKVSNAGDQIIEGISQVIKLYNKRYN